MLVPLGEVVTAPGPLVGPEQPAQAALAALAECDAPDACVVDGAGRFLGIVTDCELLKAVLNGSLSDLRIEQVMHRRPATLTAEQTLADAARLFRDGNLSRVPVLRDGQLIGMVRRRDVLKWIANWTPAPSATVQPPKFATAAAALRETTV